MRVLISQRVDLHAARDERRDALDQAWGATLDALLGRPVTLLALPNRPEAATPTMRAWNPQLLVLSGGNDIGEFPERDQTERAMLQYAGGTGVPVLGVCRGMQMIQHFLGGRLKRLPQHVACEHVVYAAAGAMEVAASPARLRVNSYHEWGIDTGGLAPGLQSLYLHEDGSVEAARHLRLPWLAVMWHPERHGLGEPAAGEWIGRWLREVPK